MSGKIFISYRRSDAAGFALTIQERLARRFGAGQIFMDVDSIGPGADFVDSIEKAIPESSVVLTLIGERWDTRRLHDPRDFVRLEILAALKHKILIVPVLLEDREMPSAADLPLELAPFVRKNAVEVRCNSDINRLVELLAEKVSQTWPKFLSDPRSAARATFGDVPVEHWAWPFVEAIARAGLTIGYELGYEPGLFCPGAIVSRAETAVFLVRGTRGPDFVPPPARGTLFQDVPAGYWAASWIEQIARDGFTSGYSLSPPLYCPAQPLNRDEMAVFLLRAKHGSTYTPRAAKGTVFRDVHTSYWAAPWIEQLAAERITAGCGNRRYCPGDPVTRAQMAVCLTRTFNLPLPT